MHVRLIASTLFLIAAGSSAHAATLRLVPSAGTVLENSGFTVDLILDAADAPGAHPGLIGGEIIVDFDRTLLAYGGFTLADALDFFSPPAIATSGNTQTVTFGFENAPDVGTVGTFSFTAIGGPGSLAVLGLVDADDFSGSFVNADPINRRFDPGFIGTQVSISAVPLPAGVWLLGTAVGVLAARRRFRPRFRPVAA